MKKKDFFILACVFLACWPGAGAAELMKPEIPDVEIAPGLNSVLSLKNSIMPKKDDTTAAVKNVGATAAEGGNALAGVSTNGYLLPDSSIIVDNPTEPKCVFYGNYNEGSGDAFQYLDVNTIVFECQ